MRKSEFFQSHNWPLFQKPQVLHQRTQEGILVPGTRGGDLHNLRLNDPLPIYSWLAGKSSASAQIQTQTPLFNSLMKQLNHSIHYITLLIFFCLMSHFNESVEQYQAKLLIPFKQFLRETSASLETLCIFSNFLGIFQNLSLHT